MLKKLAILTLGATLALFFVGCGEKSPKDVAVSFVEDVYKGNGDSLIKYVHLPEAQKAGAKELIEGKLKAGAEMAEETAKEAGGLKNIEVISEEVNEKNATIKLRANFKNGESKDEYVKLINVDDKWKVKL